MEHYTIKRGIINQGVKMFNEESYIDPSCGLELDPDTIPNQRQNENAILFLTLYYFLKQINSDLDYRDLDTYRQIIDNIRTYGDSGLQIAGLYDRGAGESLNSNKDSIRTISHDNLTAIACFSKLMEFYDFREHKDIKNHGEQSLWRFDNAYPGKPRWSRIQHPRDIIFWSYLGKSLWAKPLIWYPMLECILACWSVSVTKPDLFTKMITWMKTREWPQSKTILLETSGKLLAFVRLYVVKDKWWGRLTWKICTYLINKRAKRTWAEIFHWYFSNTDHPINQIVNEIALTNPNIRDR
jgi:hypothetical protein